MRGIGMARSYLVKLGKPKQQNYRQKTCTHATYDDTAREKEMNRPSLIPGIEYPIVTNCKPAPLPPPPPPPPPLLQQRRRRYRAVYARSPKVSPPIRAISQESPISGHPPSH